LRAGTYSGGIRFNDGGSPGHPIVLRSYPGEQALVTGRTYIPRGSNYLAIADLSLNGAHQPNNGVLPSPTVDADHVTFEFDDITNDHTAICFDLGNPVYGTANSTVIADSRIHGCGRLPADNHEHGIYVDHAIATTITGNWIYDNADRGIQLYPSAQRTRIADNVIAGNGEGIIFSGAEGLASSNNLVEHNVIADSLIRADIESFYPAGNPIGVANTARENCLSGGHPTVDRLAGGFRTVGNVVAPPDFVDPTIGDLRLRQDSPCARIAPAVPRAPDTNGSDSTGTSQIPGPRDHS
jgi:parallel beta-helix repeat protein